MNIGSYGSFDISTNLPDGSVTAPSITFASDPDTGMYSAGSNQIGFACGGLPALTFDRDLLTASGNVACWNVNAETYVAAPGGSSACSFSFTGDEDTGMYLGGTDTLEFATNGVSRLTLTTGLLTSSVFLRGPGGAATTPTYGFSADTNTGIYRAGEDIIGFTAGGTERMRITTSLLSSSVPINTSGNLVSGNVSSNVITASTGAVGAPSYSFSGDPNTGMFSSGADTINFATNGVQRLALTTGILSSTVPFRGNMSSAAFPAYSFSTDSDTGLWSSALDNVDIGTGGVNRLNISNSVISALLPINSTGNITCGNVSANALTGTTITCSAQPLIVLRTSEVQTLVNNTHTYLDFFGFTTTANVGGFGVFTDGNVRVPVAGSYLITADCLFQTDSTGFRQARLVENRATVRTTSTTTASGLGAPTGVCLSAVLTLSALANISIQAIQTSGGDSNVNASRLSIVKLY